MHLHSRSSARCRSIGAVLTDSSVQNAMNKVVNSTEAWADTHWMIYWTRKVGKTTPMPTQESWSHQGSLGLVSLVRVAQHALPQHPVILSQRCGLSMVLLWVVGQLFQPYQPKALAREPWLLEPWGI